MACSIINRTTQTTIGRNGQVVEKSKVSGSALQNPDLSRMTLDALMRKQMRTPRGNARGFWHRVVVRAAIANGNDVQSSAV